MSITRGHVAFRAVDEDEDFAALAEGVGSLPVGHACVEAVVNASDGDFSGVCEFSVCLYDVQSGNHSLQGADDVHVRSVGDLISGKCFDGA